MKHLLTFGLILSLIIPIWATTAPPAEAQSGVGTFEAVPCPYEVPPDAVCGYVTVPTQHEDPFGATMRVMVTVLPSRADDPAPDPLVMETGGPGGATILEVGPVAMGSLGDAIRQHRDIIMVEMRGSLYSPPFLFCQPLYDLLMEEMETEVPESRYDLVIDACMADLEAQGVDLANYTSLEIVGDIVMAVDALGYDRFNYYGVSYGTILGQHLMRDYPERVRSVVLDAVSSLAINYIPRIGNNADRALRLLFERCAADGFCSEYYPDLETVFFQTVERLNQKPDVLNLEDVYSGQPRQVLLTGDYWMETVFNLMYWSDAVALLPALIYEVADGSPLGYYVLEQVLPHFEDFSPDMSVILSLAVTCAEDGDIDPDEYDPAGLYTYIAGRMRDFWPVEGCAAFNIPLLDAYVDDPVSSDIPTLVMSGEWDPITPPAWGDVVAETLSQAYVYTFPGVGHGAVLGGPCPESIMDTFLQNPMVEPDASCIADMGTTFTTLFDA